MNEIILKAMLFGFMYGNGWINHVCNDKYNHYNAGFSGDKESLIVVKNDLISIYNEIGKATINTRKTNSDDYDIHGITSSFIVNTSVTKDFINMGMPIGKKVEQEYLLPDWIINGNKDIKANFISGIYAAEGFTPAFQKNNKTPKTLGFNLSKRSIYFNNFKIFAAQISTILNELQIEHSYKFIDTYTCDHNKKLIFTFNNNIENIITITTVLNIKYNITKQTLFNQLKNYSLYKYKIINNLQEAYDLALKRTCSAQFIANKYNITRSQVENWRYRKSGVGIPKNILTFNEFITTYCPL